MESNNPGIVNSVFDGAAAFIEGGKAVANAAFTTLSDVNNITNNPYNNQGGGGMYSRRDSGYQSAQPTQYQPSTYPWASQSYLNGYAQQQGTPGYQGFTNPNYGKPGFYGGGFGSFSSAFPSFGQTMSGSSNWYDRSVWGSFR